MTNMQELGHPEGHDYVVGSPHLKHRELHDRLVSLVLSSVQDVARRGLPQDLLEIGAGHGGLTTDILAQGGKVVATEMSAPSIQLLERRFGMNPSFLPVSDPDGSLDVLGDERFSAILYASVLHHIPDYLSAVRLACERHLRPGGVLISIQDPLWYPTSGRVTRIVASVAYYWWRLGQGGYLRGLMTVGRRVRGRLDESNPSDMVEYHVIRQGVDQQMLHDQLRATFESVVLTAYWSTQSPLWQRLGELWGLRNTFALVATGYRGIGSAQL